MNTMYPAPANSPAMQSEIDAINTRTRATLVEHQLKLGIARAAEQANQAIHQGQIDKAIYWAEVEEFLRLQGHVLAA